ADRSRRLRGRPEDRADHVEVHLVAVAVADASLPQVEPDEARARSIHHVVAEHVEGEVALLVRVGDLDNSVARVAWHAMVDALLDPDERAHALVAQPAQSLVASGGSRVDIRRDPRILLHRSYASER